MGAEVTCKVTAGGKTSTAKVRLETDVLQIRGKDLKLDVPFRTMRKVSAGNGTLSIAHAAGTLLVGIGSSAEKWVAKILNPPSRLSKLGVKSDWRAVIVGDVDPQFVEELGAAVGTLSRGRALNDADAVFLSVSGASDFKRLAKLKLSIKPAGAIWIIRQKGSAEVTEGAVMAAGKSAGLVDVKVVGFSSTHSAMKFVIPVRDRAR